MDNGISGGEIKEEGIFPVLGEIFQAKKTGYILIKVPPGEGGGNFSLFLDRGDIIAVSSEEEEVKLGQLAIRKGWLEEENLNRALKEQVSKGGVLGEILLMEGLLKKDDLEDLLLEQFLETILHVFSIHRGEFTFHPQPVVFADNIQPLFSTPFLISLGMVFLKDFRWISSFLYEDISITPSSGSFQDLDPPFRDWAGDIMRVVEDGINLKQLLSTSPFLRFITLKTLFDLRGAGAIMIEYREVEKLGGGEKPPDTPENIKIPERDGEGGPPHQEDDILLAEGVDEEGEGGEPESPSLQPLNGEGLEAPHEGEEGAVLEGNGTYIVSSATLDRVDLTNVDHIEPVSDVFVDEVIEATEAEEDGRASPSGEEEEEVPASTSRVEEAGPPPLLEEEITPSVVEEGEASEREGDEFTAEDEGEGPGEREDAPPLSSFEEVFGRKTLKRLRKKVDIFNSIFSIIFSSFSSAIGREDALDVFAKTLSKMAEKSHELFGDIEVKGEGTIEEEALLFNLSRANPEDPSQYLHTNLSDLFSFLIYEARKVLDPERENEMIEKIFEVQHELYSES